MNIIQLAGIITSMSYSKDGGMRIGFHTNELSIEEKSEIQKYFQQFGYILFKPNEFQESEIPKGNAESKDKTPSKRLRDVIFVWYKQLNSNLDFETFYKQKIEDMINIIKTKLDK